MGIPEIRPLTGLRALLALWVVCQHFFRELLPAGVAQQAVSAGFISVHVFFVLSGYVLTVQYREVDLSVSGERRAFWWRRFARLYPLYICSLLLGFVALWPGSWESLQTLRGATRGVVQLCVLNAWWHAAMFPLNFAAWTLSAEMLFYLLFPVLLPRMVRMGDRGLCLALGLATALTLVAPTLYTVLDPDDLGRALSFNEDHVWARYLNFGAPHRVPEFIAGIAAALLVQRGWFASIRGSAVTSLLASTALVFLAAAYPFCLCRWNRLVAHRCGARRKPRSHAAFVARLPSGRSTRTRQLRDLHPPRPSLLRAAGVRTASRGHVAAPTRCGHLRSRYDPDLTARTPLDRNTTPQAPHWSSLGRARYCYLESQPIGHLGCGADVGLRTLQAKCCELRDEGFAALGGRRRAAVSCARPPCDCVLRCLRSHSTMRAAHRRPRATSRPLAV